MNQKIFYSNVKLVAIRFLVIVCLYFQLAGVISVEAEHIGHQNGIASVPAAIGGCSIFPSNNIWNTRIDNLPIHTRSNQWVNTIGRNTGFHMDFGSGTWDGGTPFTASGGRG